MKDVGRAKLDRRPNCRRTDPITSHPLTKRTMVDIFTRNRCLWPWTKPLSPVSSECDDPIACRKTRQHEGGGGGRIAADESFELQRVGTFEHHPARLRAPASCRTTISRSGRLIAVWLDFSHRPPARLLRRRKRAIARCIRRQNFFRRALQTPRIVAVKHFDQHPLGACDQHHHLFQRSLEQIGRCA
jgi:hypothetical protein